MRTLIRLGLVAACLAVLPATSASTGAANPAGTNDRIVFGRYDPTVDDTVLYTISPDGSHEQQLLPIGRNRAGPADQAASHRVRVTLWFQTSR